MSDPADQYDISSFSILQLSVSSTPNFSEICTPGHNLI